jgi:hypothetical protein
VQLSPAMQDVYAPPRIMSRSTGLSSPIGAQ